MALTLATWFMPEIIFLDKAYRAESGRQAFYESCFTAVDEIQTYFQEMEGKTFQSALEDFKKHFRNLQRSVRFRKTESGCSESRFIPVALPKCI